MRGNRLIAVLLFFICCQEIVAQTGSEIMPVDKKVRKGRLPNGLTYYIRKNTKPEQRAELRLVVNAGSIQEKDDQRGIAHFLEHMAFNGTKNFPKNELLSYLEKAGVRFGADLNATTNFDYTIYMLPIPVTDEKLLHSGIQVLRDWAGNMLLEQEEIDKERGIILEEKRMRQNASLRTYAQVIPILTNNSLYGTRLPIGLEDIIKTAPRSIFKKFYEDWYQPKNMAVIVVGDIDVDQVEKKIKASFQNLAVRPQAPVRVPVTPIRWHAANVAQIVSDPENTNSVVNIYFTLRKKENRNTWTQFKNEVYYTFLDELLKNRFALKVVEPQSPVSFVGMSTNADFQKGYATQVAFALPKDKPEDAIHMLVGEIKKAQQFGFNKEEIELARKNLLKSLEEDYLEKDKTESSIYVQQYVANFLENEPMAGIEAEKPVTQKMLESINAGQLQAKLRELDLSKPAFILYTTNEQGKNKTTSPQLLDAYTKALAQEVIADAEKKATTTLVEKLPPPGRIVETISNDKMETKTLVLENGIRVIYKKTNFKNDEIVFRAYQWGGLSNLSTDNVVVSRYIGLIGSMGVAAHRAADMPRLLAGVNAYMLMNVQASHFSMSGGSSANDLEKFIQLLYLRLTQINFNEEDFNAVRSNQLSQMAGISKNPVFRFRDSVYRFRYHFSEKLPGIPVPQDSSKVTLASVKSLYDQLSANWNGLTLYFVGNIDEEKLQALVKQYIAGIPTKSTPVTLNASNLADPITGKNRFIMTGGKENKSEILHSYYGSANNLTDRQILAFSLLTEIFQMQATRKLREEMGSTYSPMTQASYIRPPQGEFNLFLSVSSLPENTDAIIKAFDGLVQDLLDGKLDDENMQKAISQRLKATETSMSTNGYWAYIMDLQDSYQIDPSALIDYNHLIKSITKEEVVSIAKQLLGKASILTGIMNPEKQ